jgi:hypothetical protein
LILFKINIFLVVIFLVGCSKVVSESEYREARFFADFIASNFLSGNFGDIYDVRSDKFKSGLKKELYVDAMSQAVKILQLEELRTLDIVNRNGLFFVKIEYRFKNSKRKEDVMIVSREAGRWLCLGVGLKWFFPLNADWGS